MKSGQWIYPNGLYWKGNFANNMPMGVGTWIFKNGNTLEGEFSQAPPSNENEEEAAAEEEEGELKKVKNDLVW